MNSLYSFLTSLMIGLLLCYGPSITWADNEYPFDYTFELVDSKRVGRTLFEYTFALTIKNNDKGVKNLSFTFKSDSPHTTVTDGYAFLGDISPGSTTTGQDTLAFIHDRRFPFDHDAVKWKFDFDVQPHQFGEPGPHDVSFYIEKKYGNSVIYYPSDISTENKTPLIFFAPGWGSKNPGDYASLLTFIASHGYSVIYAKDDQEYSAAHFLKYFEQMLDETNDVLPYVDTTRIGVIGHSSGGGDTFRILEYFSNKGYGNSGRFLMALDPWFAFDMTPESMRSLPSNTNVVFLQFGKDGGETDPRIPLTEYMLLTSIPADQKDYQVYVGDGVDHYYPAGDKPYEQMTGVLKTLDALMEYTFSNKEEAYDSALGAGSDHPVEDGIQKLRPIYDYQYRCNSHANYGEISEIDYCAIYGYPKRSLFNAIPTDWNMKPPEYLEPEADTVFNTEVIRITDRANQSANAHPYPKTQAWNSDMSLIRLGYRLYDAHTLLETNITAQTLIDGMMTEMKWSAKDPHVFFGIDPSGNDFSFVKATIGQVAIQYEKLFSFSKAVYEELLLGKYEGNIDFHDKFVVFAARKQGKNYLTAIVYDIEKSQITTAKDFTNIRWTDDNGRQVLDWISVSPLGNYILINWKDDPDNQNVDRHYSIYEYDINLNFLRKLAHQGQHGDMGVDEKGREVYVQFEFGGADRGIWLYPLSDGERIRLLPDKYNGGHVSCRNYKRPGYCYLSTTEEGFREVFALKLDGSGLVNRFAQTHTSGHDSHGGVSPDGTKVIFESDWGEEGGVKDTYQVQIKLP